jgi:secreted PhoX family phosphatase
MSLGATFAALGCALPRDGAPDQEREDSIGYGPLVPDSAGVIDLPEGFNYQIFSSTGDAMDDGLLVPGTHDGMAAFPGPDGLTLLVRNHELVANDESGGPFGPERALRSRLDPSMIYDAQCLGGTTNLVYDTNQQRLVRHYLSLVGTVRNCAGGPTPWNTWISCEESVQRPDDVHRQDHGYNFEVACDSGSLVQPIALKAMGRFNHEAIAVDAASGVVYQTEDRGDSVLYRFIPDTPGRLVDGGRLQALRIMGMDGVDTSNNETPTVEPGREYGVEWVDIEDPESPADDLRLQGVSKGAATFARGEGIWSAPGEVYVAATSGGAKELLVKLINPARSNYSSSPMTPRCWIRSTTSRSRRGET